MNKKLLNDQQLAQSAVVANNRMNRKRKATGINSYEKDLKFNPITFLVNRESATTLQWLDLCCGEGNALIEAAVYFKNKAIPIQLTGIDLVNYYSDASAFKDFLDFQTLNLSDWQPDQQYDLITIVHGLHYLGDKLGLIQKVAAALKTDGVFFANLDLNNISIVNEKNTSKRLKNYFKISDLVYHSRTKILKIIGQKKLSLPFQYLGADDKIGPNYTGQAAVLSYYGPNME